MIVSAENRVNAKQLNAEQDRVSAAEKWMSAAR
jgi:hypothetical protein